MPMKRCLDPAFVDEFTTKLAAARARLLRTVATTDDELATLENHQPGAPVEDVARGEAIAVLARLGDRETRELAEIDAAQARLEAGTFGLCEACGDPLPLARLRALPTARRCLPCQTGNERRS